MDVITDLVMPIIYPGGIFEPGQTTATLFCTPHVEEPALVVSGPDSICVIQQANTLRE